MKYEEKWVGIVCIYIIIVNIDSMMKWRENREQETGGVSYVRYFDWWIYFSYSLSLSYFISIFVILDQSQNEKRNFYTKEQAKRTWTIYCYEVILRKRRVNIFWFIIWNDDWSLFLRKPYSNIILFLTKPIRSEKVVAEILDW
jgi:hypothetical protein